MNPLTIISVLLLSIVEGYELEPKIFMGTPSSGKPWLVALRRISNYKICGGTLYTKSLVISAAHCIDDQPREWRAYINQYDLNQTNEMGSSSYRVLDFKKHPNYVDGHHLYDISVGWIESDSSERTSVVLDKGLGANDKSRLVNIAGWGMTERREGDTKFTTDRIPELLHEARVPLNEDRECLDMYPQEYDPRMMICTGYYESNSDSCQGDSGGPIYRTNGDQIILIGIISHGFGCGDHGYYSQDVRISNPNIRIFINKYGELYGPKNLVNTPRYKSIQEDPQQARFDPAMPNVNPSPEIRPQAQSFPGPNGSSQTGFPSAPNAIVPSFRSIQTNPSFTNSQPGTRKFETSHSYSHEKRTDSNGITWERTNGSPWYQMGGNIQSNPFQQYYTNPHHQTGFNSILNPSTPTIFQTNRLHSPDYQFSPIQIHSTDSTFPTLEFHTQTGFPSLFEQSAPTFGTHSTTFGTRSLGGLDGLSFSTSGGSSFGSGSSFGHLFRRADEVKEKNEPLRIY